jgi:hypothetical protein
MTTKLTLDKAGRVVARDFVSLGLANHFDGDSPVQALVFSGANDTHAAFADLPYDPIPADTIGKSHEGRL